MVTWDDLDNQKSNSFDDEQANIYMMLDKDEKIKVKTFSKFDTSSCSLSNDEDDMHYDVLLQNSHMIYLQ